MNPISDVAISDSFRHSAFKVQTLPRGVVLHCWMRLQVSGRKRTVTDVSCSMWANESAAAAAADVVQDRSINLVLVASSPLQQAEASAEN